MYHFCIVQNKSHQPCFLTNHTQCSHYFTELSESYEIFEKEVQQGMHLFIFLASTCYHSYDLLTTLISPKNA